MCTQAEVNRFAASIPSVVESLDSPWLDYLRYVYGDRPVLPYRLADLNFFYHRDQQWPESLEWPLMPCKRAHTGMVPYLDPLVPQCNSSQCSRWMNLTAIPKTSYSFVLFPNGYLIKNDSTRGTAFYTIPPSNYFADVNPNASMIEQEKHTFRLSSKLPNHQTYANDTWVEVMRMNERVMKNLLFAFNNGNVREGEESYGCWTYPARGSGIWVNVGQTYALHSKDHTLELYELARRAMGHLPNAMKYGARTFERFPKVAAALGYETVQAQFKTLAPRRKEYFGELVLLSKPHCMSRNESSLPPLRTCLPFADLRVGAMPAARPENGTGRSWPMRCECDEQASFSLNCAARAGSGARHTGPQMRGPGLNRPLIRYSNGMRARVGLDMAPSPSSPPTPSAAPPVSHARRNVSP